MTSVGSALTQTGLTEWLWPQDTESQVSRAKLTRRAAFSTTAFLSPPAIVYCVAAMQCLSGGKNQLALDLGLSSCGLSALIYCALRIAARARAEIRHLKGKEDEQPGDSNEALQIATTKKFANLIISTAGIAAGSCSLSRLILDTSFGSTFSSALFSIGSFAAAYSAYRDAVTNQAEIEFLKK
jgi:hypothetical protein